MTHDLNLIGFKCGKYAVVFLHCANLAELELSPRTPLPIWLSVGGGQKRDFCAAGRVAVKRSRYARKVLVATDRARVAGASSRPRSCPDFFPKRRPDQRRLRTRKQTRPLSLHASSWPVRRPDSLLVFWIPGKAPAGPLTPVLDSGRPFSRILQQLLLARDFFLFSS